MKPVFIDFDYNSTESLYVQLYKYLKHRITIGEIRSGERLPSLRQLSNQIGVSITTCSRAYDQLLLEGYIESKPQSGYYVSELDLGSGVPDYVTDTAANSADYPTAYPAANSAAYPAVNSAIKKIQYDSGKKNSLGEADEQWQAEEREADAYYYDISCFDFIKWKKCASGVMTFQQESLLSPADPQGEYSLRVEISKYLYRSRGVTADPGQIVISAGVQQLTNHLARILSHIKIDFVNVEDPGYKPVQHIFRDRGFTINKVPVASDGIDIAMLPVNISTAVYVSPSNQFPTGSVMPAARRYSLLKWADENDSIIIEDDYDSELRYFGDPVPALTSLDVHGRTVYLGSFSSTLFPAVKISYMILPEKLAAVFDEYKRDYDQTCSKIEQLTLASFMEQGFYQAGIRKIRKLYAKKLGLVIRFFREYGNDRVTAEDTMSGMSIRLDVKSDKTAEELCEEAGSVRLHMVPLPASVSRAESGSSTDKRLIFYYNQIPESEIDSAIQKVCQLWNHWGQVQKFRSNQETR